MAYIPSGPPPGLQNPLTTNIKCADHSVLNASEVETEKLTLTGLDLESQQYVLGYNPISGEVTYYDPPDGTLVGIAAGNGITITGSVPTPQINLETLGLPTDAAYPSLVEVDTYGRVIDIVPGTKPVLSLVAGNGVTVTGTNDEKTVSLPNVGSAATYAYPQSISTDNQGRVTSITSGSAPTTYTAGTGLSLTGSQFANTGVLSVSAGSGISIGGTAQDLTIDNTGVLALTQGNGITITGTNTNKTIALPNVGVASTYSYPQLITTDGQGRVTSITPGSAYTAGTGLSLTGSQFANTGILAVNGTSGEVTASTTSGTTTVGLPAVGTAGTYAYPASIITDAKGRITMITAGTQPLTSLTAGSGISISGTGASRTIANSGILSVSGTAGQVTATTSSGATTLSLPATTTTTTFVGDSSAGLINTPAFSMKGPNGIYTYIVPQTGLDGFSLDTEVDDSAIIYGNSGGNGFVISKRDGHGLRLDNAGNVTIFGSLTTNNGQTPVTTLTAGSGITITGSGTSRTISNTGSVTVVGSGDRITASTVGGTTTLDLGSIRTATTGQRPALLSIDVYGRVISSVGQPFTNNVYTTYQSNLSAPANARSLQITLVGGGGGGSGASASWGGSGWFAGHGGGGGSGYRLTKTFNFSSSCVINYITPGAGGAAGSQPASGSAGDGGPGGDGGATWIGLTIDGVEQAYCVQGGKGGQDTSASGQNVDGANGGAGFSGGGGGCSNGYEGAGASFGSGGAGDLANGGMNGSNGQWQSFGSTNLPGGSGGMNYLRWPYNDQKWGWVEPTILGIASGAGGGGGPYGGYVSVIQTGGSLSITNVAPRSGYGGGGGGGCYINMGTLENVSPTAGAGGQVQVTFF